MITASLIRPSLDRGRVRQIFQQTGRAHVADFLVETAAREMHRALAATSQWQLSLNSGERHVDLTAEQIALLPQPNRVLAVERINLNARQGFQYIFNNIPLHDLQQQGKLTDPALAQLYAFVSSVEFIELAREVTGFADIAYADAQATLYRPGHFLTSHDDDVDGKKRRVAYVLNLTEAWRVDWGGILQFIDDDGHVAAGFAPKFNALNLFRVPQKHCVSYVTPAAGTGRFSVTGWLRAR